MKASDQTEAKATNRKLSQEFFDENLRISRIHWIAAQGDTPDDTFEEDLEEIVEDKKECARVFPGLKRYDDPSDLYHAKFSGFLVRMECAWPIWSEKVEAPALDNCWYCGHGQRWFYAETLGPELIEVGRAFAEELKVKCLASELKRRAKAKEASATPSGGEQS